MKNPDNEVIIIQIEETLHLFLYVGCFVWKCLIKLSYSWFAFTGFRESNHGKSTSGTNECLIKLRYDPKTFEEAARCARLSQEALAITTNSAGANVLSPELNTFMERQQSSMDRLTKMECPTLSHSWHVIFGLSDIAHTSDFSICIAVMILVSRSIDDC
jgi:hypothetical protein